MWDIIGMNINDIEMVTVADVTTGDVLVDITRPRGQSVDTAPTQRQIDRAALSTVTATHARHTSHPTNPVAVIVLDTTHRVDDIMALPTAIAWRVRTA